MIASQAAIALVVATMLLAATASCYTSARITAALGENGLRSGVTWFGEPIHVDRTVTDEMFSRRAPLEGALIRVPIRLAIRAAAFADPETIPRGVVALAAGCWAGVMFLLLRALGLQLIDVFLLTMLCVASAAARIWFAVPARPAWGAIPVVAAMALAIQSRRRPLDTEWPTFIIVVLCIGTSAVNVVYGLLAAMFAHGWRRGLQVTSNAVCLILILWPLQRVVFPVDGAVEATTAASSLAHSILLAANAAVLPAGAIQAAPDGIGVGEAMAQDGVHLAATALWVALLGFGAWFLVRSRELKLAAFLVTVFGTAILAGSLTGTLSFAAALDLLPVAAIVAGLGALTQYRHVVRGIAMVLIVLMVANHAAVLERAVVILQGLWLE